MKIVDPWRTWRLGCWTLCNWKSMYNLPVGYSISLLLHACIQPTSCIREVLLYVFSEKNQVNRPGCMETCRAHHRSAIVGTNLHTQSCWTESYQLVQTFSWRAQWDTGIVGILRWKLPKAWLFNYFAKRETKSDEPLLGRQAHWLQSEALKGNKR